MNNNSKNAAAYPASEFLKKRGGTFPLTQATPHLGTRTTTRTIMGDVLIALSPAFIGSLYFFGFGVLPYYLVGILSAVVVDLAAQWVRHRTFSGFDLSAIVTGTLLVMSLPLGVPLWFAALGSAFGVLVAKELFGGIGRNFLNPALTGRLLLRLVFSQQMLQNPLPNPPFGFGGGVDAMASATPLAMAKETGIVGNATLLDSFLGNTGGKIGETSALLLLIGAAWLIGRGVIRLRIPLSLLGATAVMAFVFGGQNGLFSAGYGVVLAHLLGGSTMLATFYMATDYGSSPSAPAAQYLFGALVGVINMLFRLYSPWAEGMTFALLIANCAVPLLNRLVRPRVLGENKPAFAEK